MRVVVIGAGIAGLAAARELDALRYDTLVLEARQRAGGRIWTDTGLGCAVDLGAAWIHGIRDNPIFELCQSAEISSVPTDYNRSALVDESGRLAGLGQKLLYSMRANRVIHRLGKIASGLSSDISVAEAVNRLCEKSDFSLQEMRFLNRHLIEFEVLNASSLDDQSLFSLLSYSGDRGGDVTMPGGYSQIVDVLQEGLDIRFGEFVSSISQDGYGVSVESSGGTVDADAAIVTLPLGVLKSGKVSFSPALSKEKLKAAADLHVGNFNKIAMRFDSPFWPLNCDLIEMIPQDRTVACQFLNWFRYTGEPVLVACVAARTAMLWEELTDQETEDRVMVLLRQLFGSDVPEPIATRITRWSKDPCAMGAYSVVPPGVEAGTFNSLARCEGRLFFAGEATSAAHQGTVHGAYLSGIRCAREVCDL